METTTGPLGQGIANAVGMAMAEKHLAAKFNRDGYPGGRSLHLLHSGRRLHDGRHLRTRPARLAGTLGLNKLIALYDDNEISIEGDTDIAFREDVARALPRLRLERDRCARTATAGARSTRR